MHKGSVHPCDRAIERTIERDQHREERDKAAENDGKKLNGDMRMNFKKWILKTKRFTNFVTILVVIVRRGDGDDDDGSGGATSAPSSDLSRDV